MIVEQINKWELEVQGGVEVQTATLIAAHDARQFWTKTNERKLERWEGTAHRESPLTTQRNGGAGSFWKLFATRLGERRQELYHEKMLRFRLL